MAGQLSRVDHFLQETMTLGDELHAVHCAPGDAEHFHAQAIAPGLLVALEEAQIAKEPPQNNLNNFHRFGVWLLGRMV